MLPLLTKTFPADAAELERLLNASIRKVLITECDPVRVIDRNYPALQDIGINLNGAAIRPNPPGMRVAENAKSPALSAESFSLQGEGISIGQGSINLALQASDVAFNRGEDAEGEIVLWLERAWRGTVEVSAGKSDLEAAIAELAARAADRQGIKIEAVSLSFHQLGVREVEAEINVRAGKLFIAATITLFAELAVDDVMNATVSGLKCSGEGPMGSLACGFLTPHLEKLEGRTFPLMALSLGEIRLRDVRIEVADGLKVRADFGS